MGVITRIADWLETHWVTPAYAGWILAGIAICFFGAATNTMSGWLYVISGIIFALLGLAAILPPLSLRHLKVHRHPIFPVSVGEELTIEIDIENPTARAKTLLQVQDMLQSELGKPLQTAIETIAPSRVYHWVYFHSTKKRGVYHWHEIQLRTGNPLGLFWCRRSRHGPATAVVYPTVLPLTSCPIVDEIGTDDSLQLLSDRRSQSATEDLTRSLRPYRVGDATRLIHWRTSARYGELMVRELEVFTGSQEIIICLDSSVSWQSEDFESAVIAAASLYFYACSRQLDARLWTARTGLLHGNQVVLEALAATQPGEDTETGDPPYLPLIWLTQESSSLNSLPPGSRWLFWSPSTLAEPDRQASGVTNCTGRIIDTEEPLQRQLQQSLTRT